MSDRLPLDPKPFYVVEADEQDLGPESDAGRYDYAAGTYEDEYGRESTVSALAVFHPRKGYEQNRLAYRSAYKKPGMTLAESLGIEVDPKAPGGSAIGHLSREGEQRSTRGQKVGNEIGYEGFHDVDGYR